jgi:hypothetical protein
MKVCEMIEHLKKFPPETELIIEHDGYYAYAEWEEPCEPYIITEGKQKGKVMLASLFCQP